MSDDNFYTLEESAAILGVSRSDVEQMIHRKELQSKQEGGHRKIPVDALYRHLFPYYQPNDFFGDPPTTSGNHEKLIGLEEATETLRNELQEARSQAEFASRRERSIREERDQLLKKLEEEREARHQIQQELDKSDSIWWRRILKKTSW